MSENEKQPNPEDFNRGGMWAFGLSMIFTFVFFGYVSFFHPGVQLKEVKTEEEAAQLLADAENSFDVASVEDPWISSEGMIEHGSELYKNNCAFCHGSKGLGDGAAGAGLNPKPRNLVEGQWKKGGTPVALYNTLTNGIEGSSMASYAHFNPRDRWALTHFVRSISENAPDMDADKLAQFGQETLNN